LVAGRGDINVREEGCRGALLCVNGVLERLRMFELVASELAVFEDPVSLLKQEMDDWCCR